MPCVSVVFAVVRCRSVRRSVPVSRWWTLSTRLKMSSNFSGFIVIIIIFIVVYYANNSAKLIIKSKLKYKIHAHESIDRNTIKHRINIRLIMHQHRGSKAVPCVRFHQCRPSIWLISYFESLAVKALGFNSGSVPAGWYQKMKLISKKNTCLWSITLNIIKVLITIILKGLCAFSLAASKNSS